MELTSKVASAGSFSVFPWEADKDDLEERDARDWAKRAVLDVLEGARTVDAMCERAMGVEWMGEAICMSS